MEKISCVMYHHSMPEFGFNSNAYFSDESKRPKLDMVFDINSIMPEQAQPELMDLGIPNIPLEFKHIKSYECNECDGSGEVEISEYIGNHWYEAECECQECDGTGYSKNAEESNDFKMQTVDEDILFDYYGTAISAAWVVARTLLLLQGKPCKKFENGIYFFDSDLFAAKVKAGREYEKALALYEDSLCG
jgi:hypothetical protein